MSDDEKWALVIKVFYGAVVLIVLGVVSSAYCYYRGQRRGTCTEMCRPAAFDSDQDVNGGCLCIGSDKVLRFKKDP